MSLGVLVGVLGSQLVASLNLIRIKGDSSDVTLQEAADGSHGSTDSASNVQHLLILGEDVEMTGQLVLMAANGLGEGFTGVLVGEME